MNTFFAILLLIAGLILYFIPTFVARSNKKKAYDSIAILNLLLGWTALGWIIALVWAASKDEERTTIIKQATSSVADQLLKLNEAKEKGLLNSEEFEVQKQKLLNS